MALLALGPPHTAARWTLMAKGATREGSEVHAVGICWVTMLEMVRVVDSIGSSFRAEGPRPLAEPGD